MCRATHARSTISYSERGEGGLTAIMVAKSVRMVRALHAADASLLLTKDDRGCLALEHAASPKVATAMLALGAPMGDSDDQLRLLRRIAQNDWASVAELLLRRRCVADDVAQDALAHPFAVLVFQYKDAAETGLAEMAEIASVAARNGLNVDFMTK